MTAKNAVARTADAGLPASMDDYADYAGKGFDNHSKEDYSIPFLHVLQAQSKQVEQLENAKAGMIINTVTNDLYDGKSGITFVPAYTQHVYVEWVPREKGGGFVAIHELDSAEVKKCRETQQFGKYQLPNGNDLIETFYVYGVLDKGDGAWEQAVIAFASTKIKKYKSWMVKARNIQLYDKAKKVRMTLPLFAHAFQLKTVQERNSKGQFYNWQVSFAGGVEDAAMARLAPDDELFQAGVTTYEAVVKGVARADYASQNETGAEDSSGGANTDGEDPPY